jgi:hypothetical protein
VTKEDVENVLRALEAAFLTLSCLSAKTRWSCSRPLNLLR